MRDNTHAPCFLCGCVVWISYRKSLDSSTWRDESFKVKGMRNSGDIASLLKQYV